jgi:hypothetical protein
VTGHGVVCGLFLVLLTGLQPGAPRVQSAVAPAPAPPLSIDQMERFLRTAKVIGNKALSKGITKPEKLTLSDGTTTHDAVFQKIDQQSQMQRFATGKTEMNFRDSWHYNVAAYEVAKLVGLAEMMPVTVERSWRGTRGSLSWWLEWKWDEEMRRKADLQPPDPVDWARQQHRMRVFSQFVYDTDRNMTNQLISADWRLYMIDFSRAFRLSDTLPQPNTLLRCDAGLLARLRALTLEEVRDATKTHLTDWETRSLMKRRDLIVEHFDKLVARRGAKEVLY